MTTALAMVLNSKKSTYNYADLASVQKNVFQSTRNQLRPVKGLMTWVLDRRNLAAAWDRVSNAEGADTPGPDGVTRSQLENHVGHWLADLADSLFHQQYQPSPPRYIDIPKPGKPGQTRQIGVLNFRDRVVQAALKQVLEPVIEPIFLPGSFGFRPGRSVAGALATACRGLSAMVGEKPKLLYAVPLDVVDCFPSLDHEYLESIIAANIADQDIQRLLQRIIASGGKISGRLWWQRHCGLVQGGALSPLLCNLALHSLDVAAVKLGQDTQAGVAVLRYADDLLVLARDAQLAKKAVSNLRAVLQKQHQRFRAEPNPIPVEHGIRWLGVDLKPRRFVRSGAVEFGCIVPEDKVHSMVERLIEMTIPPSDKIDAAAFNLGKWIVSVNDQLRDWRQAYLFADNNSELFRLLDDVSRDRIGELIKAVSGMNWHDIRRQHLTRLPRGFWTWEVPGARLTVLSSLAPQCPAKFNRRPDWWVDVPDAAQPTGGA